MRQHIYGKGRSIKGHDLIAADLCGECHAEFDNLKGFDSEPDRDTRKALLSERFLHCVALTLVLDFKEGVLKT